MLNRLISIILVLLLFPAVIALIVIATCISPLAYVFFDISIFDLLSLPDYLVDSALKRF